MLLVDGHGHPPGVEVHGGAQHEVTLIKSAYHSRVYKKRKPKRLLYDRAADSNPLRWSFELNRIRLISPCRKRNNGEPAKKLNRRDRSWYQHRWKVERTISWLKNFLRLVTRYEY